MGYVGEISQWGFFGLEMLSCKRWGWWGDREGAVFQRAEYEALLLSQGLPVPLRHALKCSQWKGEGGADSLPQKSSLRFSQKDSVHSSESSIPRGRRLGPVIYDSPKDSGSEWRGGGDLLDSLGKGPSRWWVLAGLEEMDLL